MPKGNIGMSKIKELREEAMRLQTEANKKLEAMNAEGVTDERAAELEGEFDTLMDKRDKLVKQADRLERGDNARREMEEIQERSDRQSREERRSTASSDDFTPQGGESDEYREHFREFLANGADMSAVSTEARDALRSRFVQGEKRTQVSTSGAAGGFTVPTTLAGFINVAMAAHGPMWDENVATVITTASGETIVLPGVDDTASEDTIHTQGDELTDDDSRDITVVKEELGAFAYSTPWIKWAFELAQDSAFNWEQLLANLIGQAAGRTANKLLTVGTGTGQPLGFVNVSGLGKTSNSNSVIAFDELIDLVHSVDPAYRQGPKVGFQMHDQTVKAVRKIKDGNGQYIWSDGDVTRGVPPSLLGHGVRFNQAMDQVAASKKPIVFGDYSQYYVRKVGAPMIGVAREKFFPNLGIAGVNRFDGAAAAATGSIALKHLATPA